jgi:AraC-like DNA-binding protein
MTGTPAPPRAVARDPRRYDDLTPLICLTTAGSLSPKIRRAVRCLDQQYACRPTLGSVAGQLGYHPAHLSRKFHQELGVSFSGYLVRIRLKHAIRMLVYTDLPIKAIGYRVGYRRPERFAKVVRQWLQCSPTAFRTLYRYQLLASTRPLSVA